MGISVTDEPCSKAKRQQQMFSVAKAKRQLQSAQSERKRSLLF
ncbi:hypothetical protein [Lysinibacillus xylanilyticus]|nr:hypothetical protein [Lysinibacillus xylanilyticus]